MVYIYRKVIGNKGYYYLRASERKGTKVIAKDLAYLGESIEEVQKNLTKLPQYNDQIRKTYKTIHNFLESNIYLEKIKQSKIKSDDYLGDKLLEVEACKLHYSKKFKHYNGLTKEEIFKNFIIEFAFNTTNIEGNTIKLNETRNLLQNGISPKDKPLRDIYDLKNTEEVFNWLQESKQKVTHELIIEIHKRLVANIDKRIGYRTQEVRVIKSNFKATPFPYIKADMDILLKWYEKNKDKLHPLVLTTIFHHKFETIHPFFDGNGRTGRILLNYILMKNNYPPMVIHTKIRNNYLLALRKADKSNLKESNVKDYDLLIQFVSDEMVKSYWNIFL
ncbi:TPA: Fic family protein [Candidatus Woesearchaeota archaeon]|nr:Fic family protein [Candidatus Woesearchaeota archaeon]